MTLQDAFNLRNVEVLPMEYQVTVRYGSVRQSYHTFRLSAGGIADALREAAGSLPKDVAEHGDLVEIRPAARPDERSYIGEGET